MTTQKIDLLTKEKEHRIVLASPYSPERYTSSALFSRFNTPTEVSSNFVEKPEINTKCSAENGQITLEIDAEKQVTYQIYINEIPYQTINDKDEKTKIFIRQDSNENTIKVVAKYNMENDKNNLSNEKVFNMSKTSQKTPNNAKKWYI